MALHEALLLSGIPEILINTPRSRIVCAGLSLLGFKPASCLKPWHTWRQSNFVYPDERTMPGSTTAFIALHEAMLSQDRVALCTYVRSRNTEPRLVALMAAQEVKDEYGEQVSLDSHYTRCLMWLTTLKVSPGNPPQCIRWGWHGPKPKHLGPSHRIALCDQKGR